VVQPTFLIMGAQKAGTTSLYDAITRHPMVGRASKKEVHFFDRYYDRGMAWYYDQFPIASHQSHVGEATPVYMYDAEVRDLIASHLPYVKIIITLRDPVSRAYSHFWHSHRYGREELASFEEAVEAEPERLAVSGPRQRSFWSYVDRGRYIDQLEALEKLFGRDSICVVTLEETKKDPEAEISKALRHLRLDPDLVTAFELPQANSYSPLRPKELRALKQRGVEPPKPEGSPYPPMAEETRERLRLMFADSDARLMTWLGRTSLPWPTAAV
jgi:hypothetical protein